MPAALRHRLLDPTLTLSAWLRTALALGVVFLMSVKPGGAGAVTAMGVAPALGLGAWWLAAAGGRPAPVESRSAGS